MLDSTKPSKMNNSVWLSAVFSNRVFRYVVYSIISAFVGIIFCVLFHELSFYAWASIFGYFWIGLVITSLAFVIKAVVQLFRNRKLHPVLSIFLSLILVCAWYMTNSISLFENERFRMCRAVNGNGFYSIKGVGEAVSQYVKQYGRFPDANSWCDKLASEYSGKMRVDGQFPNIESIFAFNKSLSLAMAGTVSRNMVVVFETDGRVNQSGGLELLSKPREKDKYFLFKFQRFIYILFADGTIAKYRLCDEAISIYDPNTKETFSSFKRKGETPYSPLKWK